MQKVKIKVDDPGKVYLLEEYGQITYIDKMINLVFMTISDKDIDKIKQLTFVTKVSGSRKGTLQVV
ncbi:uncharacterized protein YlbG (UPF0298 family) [Natronobacillus azotifigens]|uniref:DUF2129 domain-containing protein n=1 Tax=Natronobacillus azotifigens TaxID=472978 RepID=A0A9J6RFV8_9BACI|nr:DUF2129 domain-containing protein [Natronobacillus azotifigens]MCZ0704219.1 DUF2129 domain-containing protein [Natronobacillus azotifigens]